MNKIIIITIIGLLIIWGTFLYFLVSYGDDVRRDPCSICSERMGEDIVCTVGTSIPVQRVYYKNGTIKDINPSIAYEPPKLNFIP